MRQKLSFRTWLDLSSKALNVIVTTASGRLLSSAVLVLQRPCQLYVQTLLL